MPDINLEYLNDRYLAFVIPMELRRLVGQGVNSWFGAGNEEERKHFKENYDERFPTSIPDLAAQLKLAIRKFTALLACWDTSGLIPEKLRLCSNDLETSLDEYVKTLKADWYDERHRCYMKIANYYQQYDLIPPKLQSWDLLGTHHLDHDENGLKGGNRIFIKNRSGERIDEIQIGKKQASPVVAAIKTMGWYNVERLAISQATADLLEFLNAPHRQLFELGSLLADANWGESWHSPTLNFHSRKEMTVSLARRVEKLASKLWYLLPDTIMPLLKLLRDQENCVAANKVANQVSNLCHSKLYRAKHGIVDTEYERQLLAFDLFHLVSPTLSNEQRVDVFARGSKYYADLSRTPSRPVSTFAELASLARRPRPRWVQVQIGYKSSQSADKDALKPLEIWDVLKIKKKHGVSLVFAREQYICELQNDAGVYFKLLLKAKGLVVLKDAVEQKLKISEFKVTRVKKKMPKEIRSLIDGKPGTGTWLKKHHEIKDCRFLLDEFVKPS